MTEKELKTLLARNPQATIEDNDRAKLQNPVLKSVHVETLDSKTPVKKGSRPRITVRIMSFRQRLLDRTNLEGGKKFIEDALVERGLLPGDSPEDITVSIEQTKVSRKNSNRD